MTGQRIPTADIAVAPIELSEELRFWAIETDEFVTGDKAGRLRVGNETFMVGRFVTQEGLQKNSPVARFGAISRAPDEEELYLVEHHSLPGYSGSPVFVRIDPLKHQDGFTAGLTGPRVIIDKDRYGPWLLGIDSCHMADWRRLHASRKFRDHAEPERWVPINTGVAEVVPAWLLLDLLMNNEKLVRQRKDDEDRIRKEQVDYRHPDNMRNDESDAFTRTDFEAALRKVSRKIRPQK